METPKYMSLNPKQIWHIRNHEPAIQHECHRREVAACFPLESDISTRLELAWFFGSFHHGLHGSHQSPLLSRVVRRNDSKWATEGATIFEFCDILTQAEFNNNWFGWIMILNHTRASEVFLFDKPQPITLMWLDIYIYMYIYHPHSPSGRWSASHFDTYKSC